MIEDKPFEKEQKVVNIQRFQQINLHHCLQTALTDFGYIAPTESQRKLIQSIMQGKDVLLISSPGSGISFGALIALLQIIDPSNHRCQAIYLCASREGAWKGIKPIITLTQHSQLTFRIVAGSTVSEDRQAFRKEQVQIAIGTPVRILDILQKRYINANHLKILVLDEADDLMAREFYDNIKEIMQWMPIDVIVCITSSTRKGYQQLETYPLKSSVHLIRK